MAQNDGERAARLWGAVETARAATSVPIAAYKARDYDRWLAAAHAQFDRGGLRGGVGGTPGDVAGSGDR